MLRVAHEQLILALDKAVAGMVGFFCKEVRPGSRRDFLFLGAEYPQFRKGQPQVRVSKANL